MSNPLTPRLLRVIDHIHANPAGDLSLDALADVAAMSRFHWHRCFRALTGETVAQAVRRIRLERAAMALIHGPDSVARIAAEVGYPNAASFSRAFGEHFGLTPTAFRRRGLPPARHQSGPIQEFPMHPVEITHRPALRLAALRHVGPYDQMDAVYDRLHAVCAPLFGQGVIRGAASVYYDNPAETPAAQLRSAVGYVLAEGVQIDPPLVEVTLPAGRAAVLHHRGPYTTLAAAYDQLYCDWLPTSGEEPADTPPYEVYLNNPADTAPSDLRTDICLMLRG